MRLFLLQKLAIIWYVWELKLSTHPDSDPFQYRTIPDIVLFHVLSTPPVVKGEQWTLRWGFDLLKIAFLYIISLSFHIILYSRSHDFRFTNEDMKVWHLAVDKLGAGEGAQSAVPMLPEVSGVHHALMIQKYLLLVSVCSSQYQTLWGWHR